MTTPTPENSENFEQVKYEMARIGRVLCHERNIIVEK